MALENLARISKKKRNEDDAIPFSTATLYRWHHVNKFPGLFIKIGSSLFVDKKRLGEIAEQGRTS